MLGVAGLGAPEIGRLNLGWLPYAVGVFGENPQNFPQTWDKAAILNQLVQKRAFVIWGAQMTILVIWGTSHHLGNKWLKCLPNGI